MTPWDSVRVVVLPVRDPDQAPLAVQEVGLFVALQERTGLTEPAIPEVGETERVTAGKGTELTATFVHGEQLLLSDFSVMMPEEALFVLSTQTRRDEKPEEVKVILGEVPVYVAPCAIEFGTVRGK